MGGGDAEGALRKSCEYGVCLKEERLAVFCYSSYLYLSYLKILYKYIYLEYRRSTSPIITFIHHFLSSHN